MHVSITPGLRTDHPGSDTIQIHDNTTSCIVLRRAELSQLIRLLTPLTSGVVRSALGGVEKKKRRAPAGGEGE